MAKRSTFRRIAKKTLSLVLVLSLMMGLLTSVVSADYGKYSYDECSVCNGTGGYNKNCKDCHTVKCDECGGDGIAYWVMLVPVGCSHCDDGKIPVNCNTHTCASCEGTGRSYYAEHLDIRFDATATVVIDGVIKTVAFNINAEDYREGRITVSGGTVKSLGSDTSGDQNDLRLNGKFPIGTPTNPISYTVTLTNKTIKVDGVDFVVSSTINDITAWGSNTCPSGVGIDVAFGNVASTEPENPGTPDVGGITSGSITVYKFISGVTTDDAETFTFNLTNLNDATVSVDPITVVVPAGNNGASTTVSIPFGTYSISEAPSSDIVIGDDTYELTSTDIAYPDEDNNSATEETSFTVSKTNFARQVNITNTYEKQAPTPPPVTTGTITVNKTITGVTPKFDTTYNFKVGTEDLAVTVKAGTTSGTNSITLPFGAYEVSEITTAMTDVTGTDDKAYEFVSASAAQTVSISETAATASAAFTNAYTQKITEGTLTITKMIEGVALTAANQYSFTVAGEGISETVTVEVASGATSGAKSITLPLGTYTVTEDAASKGNIVTDNGTFKLTETTQSKGAAVLTKAENTASVTVTNKYSKVEGALTITKTVDKAPASEMTFTFNVSGISTPVSVTIPANGTFGSTTIENLDLGTYTVSETESSKGNLTAADGVYAHNEVIYSATSATLTADATTATIAVTNKYEKITGSLTVTKVISGATSTDAQTYSFSILNGNNVVDTISVTVPAGASSATSDAITLELGTYSVVENIAAAHTIANGEDNYKLTGTSYSADSVALTETALTASVTVTNSYEFAPPPVTEGTVTITKVITGTAPTSSVQYSFNIIDNTGAIAATATVEVKAGATKAKSEPIALPLGDFTVEEVIAKDHTISDGTFKLTGTTYSKNTLSITADDNTDALTVTNAYAKVTGKLAVTKTVNIAPDADTVYSFKVTSAAGKAQTVNVTVNAGELTGTSDELTLDLGKYTVEEIIAAGHTIENGGDEYKLVSTVYSAEEATLTATALTASVTVTNNYEIVIPDPTTGKLTVTKTVNVAPNADTTYTFNILDKSGNTAATVTATIAAGKTSASAKAVELPFGKYTVEEVISAGHTIENGENSYIYAGTTYSAAATLSLDALTAVISVANNYEMVQPPVEPTASLTLTKVIDGPAPTVATNFSINIYDAATSNIIKTVDIAIPAGETSGSTTVNELKLGDYTILERLPSDAGYSYTVNGTSYVFASASYTENEFSFDADKLAARAVITNSYSEIYNQNPTETTAPETSAPETTVPETTAPETSAPETSAPETSAPVESNDEPAEIEEIEEEPVPLSDDAEIEEVEEEPEMIEEVEEVEEIDEIEEFEEIEEDEVPLTDIPDEPVPQTGYSTVWFVIGLISAAALTVVTVAEKKSKANN